MVVAKFGGSSLSDGENWRRVLNIVKEGDRQAVVVSAPGARFVGDEKVTDLLLSTPLPTKNKKKPFGRKLPTDTSISRIFRNRFFIGIRRNEAEIDGRLRPVRRKQGRVPERKTFFAIKR